MSDGWIGVDLDGTVAQYDGWAGGSIGAPIGPMVHRIVEWLRQGIEVRIVTARVSIYTGNDPRKDASEKQAEEQRVAIQAWTKEHIGTELKVTCSKDYDMLELWDDRAVQVVKNTGLTLNEHAMKLYQEQLHHDGIVG